MATTTKRVTFTKTKSYSFTVDYPNYSAVSDASVLAAALLPNGTCALGELLSGSSPNLGIITNIDTALAPSTTWAVGVSSNVEACALWSASTAFASAAVIAPSVPTSFLLTAGSAGTHGATEGIRTAVNATSMVVGNVYEINVPGTTDFTQDGALNSTAGTKFVCTSAGTGTGTTYLLWNGTGTTVVGGVTFTAAAKTQTYAAMATSTAYVLGQVVTVSSKQLQCIVAGTTAGTLPGLPAVGFGVISGTAAFLRIQA